MYLIGKMFPLSVIHIIGEIFPFVKINFYFNKTKARSIEAVLPALLSSARLLIPLHACLLYTSDAADE